LSFGHFTMHSLAERYVRLVLAVGQHDAAYVDAYYGPPDWRREAEAEARPLAALLADAASLLQAVDASPANAGEHQRRLFLRRQIEAVGARLEQLAGRRFTFDDESRAFYDAVAPVHDDAYFQSTLDELDRALPGRGALIDRLEAFRAAFIIPRGRLGPVFERAIDECRRQTRARIELPDDERFTVEYVSDKPWSGYNWYHGAFRSVIQVNTDLPIFIDRAIDLAAHEGYPGHHVFNVVLERDLVTERRWIEFTVYPLFSPESLIAEGTANFGIEVAFPGESRARFNRDVLMPLAGIPVADADRYAEVVRLGERLAYAGNEAARRYLDGAIDRAAAIDWLTRFALMSRARAEQRTRFMDVYRSYVINYNLGQDLVRGYIERRGGTADRPDVRWREFLALLRTPHLPSQLQ
jgi:hypothetical protein